MSHIIFSWVSCLICTMSPPVIWVLLILQVNLYDRKSWGPYCGTRLPWSLYSTSNMVDIYYTNSLQVPYIYAHFVYQATSKCISLLNDSAHYIWRELGSYTHGQIFINLYEPFLIIEKVNMYHFLTRGHYMEHIVFPIKGRSLEEVEKYVEISIYEGASSLYDELCIWKDRSSRNDVTISTNAFQAFITLASKLPKGQRIILKYKFHWRQISLLGKNLSANHYASISVKYPNLDCPMTNKVMFCPLKFVAPPNHFIKIHFE